MGIPPKSFPRGSQQGEAPARQCNSRHQSRVCSGIHQSPSHFSSPPWYVRCCKQALRKKPEKSQILDSRAGCQARGTGHCTRGTQAVPSLPGWGWTHCQDKKAFRGMESRVFRTRSQQPARAYLVAPGRRSRAGRGGLLPASPALPEAVPNRDKRGVQGNRDTPLFAKLAARPDGLFHQKLSQERQPP